ncbi:sensor domain-containing diguanylate cyclase [Patulibacter sp.]|uniref:sensor domain-containing diguanylate cyclase n=1 Tax=Patulibacter sp. TaxID=1912859 RepID=UPI00271A9B18|nr:diguanylate cyclase [Patulibacter sp.]MDO9410725.1 diguanylate cyclase [Patulibacter sp.]
MTTDAPSHAAGPAAPADPGPTDAPSRRAIEVPLALTPLSEGDVRVHVSPVSNLAQLDAITATMRSFRQVEDVAVGAVAGEVVQLRVRLREPLAFAGQLRTRLGSAVVSVTAAADRLVVALDPTRTWFPDGPLVDAPTAPGGAPIRAVSPLVAAPGPTRTDASPGPAAAPAGRRATDVVVPGPIRASRALEDRAMPSDRASTPVRQAPPRPAPATAPAATRTPRAADGRPRTDLAADVLARNVLDAIPDTSVLVLDESMHFRAVAGTALAKAGFPRDVLLGRHAHEALPVLPWDVVEPACRAALRGDASALEFETLDRSGVFEATVSPVRDVSNGTGAVLVLRDVTTRRRDAAVIADADEMFELSFARAPIGKAIVAPDGRFLKVNDAFCRLLGHPEEALLEGDFRHLTHPEDLDTDEALLAETLEGLRDGYVLEKRYLHAEGRVVHAQLSVALVRESDGTPRWFVAQVIDMTARRQLEDELRTGTENDGLTGLWNRSRLHVELALRARESQRYGVGASLLAIDLDEFALVEETLGRARGDAFLRTVAGAIRSTVRDCDHCAHPGEDEFVVLLPHTRLTGASIVADRIAEALTTCDAPGLPPGFLRASIGVAELVPGMSAERWLHHATEARRQARRAGGGRAVMGTGPDADVPAPTPAG